MNAYGPNGGVRRCHRCGAAGHMSKTCRWSKGWAPVEAMRWRLWCACWGQIGLAVVLNALRAEILELQADALQAIGRVATTSSRELTE